MEKNCNVVEIITPKRVILQGLWFGSQDPTRVFIFVHGLGSSVFSHHDLLLPFVDTNVSVLFFNNRGHDKITRIKKIDLRKKKGATSIMGGETHEVFIDCKDDLEGVVQYTRRAGAKEIFLVGHSTGCQKIVYYLSSLRDQSKITGAILLCPISDYAAILKFIDKDILLHAQKKAEELIKDEKPHELLPFDTWPPLHDAQRFLSLYSGSSEEEIFTYWDTKRKPTRLLKIKIPLLIVLAEKDEYRDRSTKRIAAWFEKKLKKSLPQARFRPFRAENRIVIVEDALHSFWQKDKEVVKEIGEWIKTFA